MRAYRLKDGHMHIHPDGEYIFREDVTDILRKARSLIHELPRHGHAAHCKSLHQSGNVYVVMPADCTCVMAEIFGSVRTAP